MQNYCTIPVCFQRWIGNSGQELQRIYQKAIGSHGNKLFAVTSIVNECPDDISNFVCKLECSTCTSLYKIYEQMFPNAAETDTHVCMY